MPTQRFRWQARIRFVDTDASQRIHYTAMFRLFEAAEMEFLRSMNCAYTTAEFRDFSFPRVHVECDFSAEIRFDDLVEVEVSVERVGTSSFTLGFETLLEGKAAARGRIVVVAIDKRTQKACAIPAQLASGLRGRLG